MDGEQQRAAVVFSVQMVCERVRGDQTRGFGPPGKDQSGPLESFTFPILEESVP